MICMISLVCKISVSGGFAAAAQPPRSRRVAAVFSANLLSPRGALSSMIRTCQRFGPLPCIPLSRSEQSRKGEGEISPGEEALVVVDVGEIETECSLIRRSSAARPGWYATTMIESTGPKDYQNGLSVGGLPVNKTVECSRLHSLIKHASSGACATTESPEGCMLDETVITAD